MLTLCSCGVNKTFFHYSCLLQWLAKHSYCPACRYASHPMSRHHTSIAALGVVCFVCCLLFFWFSRAGTYVYAIITMQLMTSLCVCVFLWCSLFLFVFSRLCFVCFKLCIPDATTYTPSTIVPQKLTCARSTCHPTQSRAQTKNRGYLFFEERHMGANRGEPPATNAAGGDSGGGGGGGDGRGRGSAAIAREDYGQSLQRALRAGLDAADGDAGGHR